MTTTVVTFTNVNPINVSGTTVVPMDGSYQFADLVSRAQGFLVYTNLPNGTTTNYLYFDVQNGPLGWVMGTNKLDAGALDGITYIFPGSVSNVVATTFYNRSWLLSDDSTAVPGLVVTPSIVTAIANTVATITNSGWAKAVNISDFGAVPCYFPGIGQTWTSGPACDQQLALAFTRAQNLGIDTIEFPPGIWRFQQTIQVPSAIRGIVGHGVLHNSRTGIDQQSTKPFSQIWFDTGGTNLPANSTNFIGLTVNTDVGRFVLRDIEVCGCTNPVMPAGTTGTNMQTVDKSAFGMKGIVVSHGVSGFSGGDVLFENANVCGWVHGVEYFGNSARFSQCNFGGNDIGFVHTNNVANDYNIDQVIFENCGVGNRTGGIGYFLHNVHDSVFVNSSDLYFHTWAVLDQCNVTIIGGNSEFDNVNTNTWSIHRQSATSFYPTNRWDYDTNCLLVCIGQPSFIDVHGWRCRSGSTNYIVMNTNGLPAGTTLSGENFLFQTDGTTTPATNRLGLVNNNHMGRFGMSGSYQTNALSQWPLRPSSYGEVFIVNSNGTLYELKAGPAGVTWASTNVIGL